MRCARCLTVLMIAIATAGPALAQSAAEKATARALAEEGAEKYAANDFSGALNRFQKAAQIVTVPTVSIWVARSHVQLGQLVAAQSVYQKIVAEPVPAKSAPQIKQAVAEAQTELDALLPRIPQVRLTIKGPEPSATTLTIDGVNRSADIGTWVSLDPGVHKVRAQASRWNTTDVQLELKEGERKPFVVELGGAAPVAVAPKPPAAESAAPPSPAPPRRGPTLAATGPDTGAQGSSHALEFAAIGLGTAGILVGGVLGAMTLSKKSDFTSSCEDKRCPPGAQEDYDSAKTLATWSTVGFVAGGGLLAAGIVMIVVEPKVPSEGKSSSVGPRATVGLGPGSLTVRGTF